MLIKGVTKTGDAIPMSPNEAFPKAVVRAVSTMNDSSWVYIADEKSVVLDSPIEVVADKMGWVATGKGKVMVGKCRVSDDQFFVPKMYEFAIRCASTKDLLGIPDIELKDVSIEPVKKVDVGGVKDALLEAKTLSTKQKTKQPQDSK